MCVSFRFGARTQDSRDFEARGSNLMTPGQPRKDAAGLSRPPQAPKFLLVLVGIMSTLY